LAHRIGILGGTFNPVHYGHLAAAEEVRDRLKLDRVLFIPAFLPPHKNEELPSAVQRLEMVRLAVAGNPHCSVSDMEIKRGGRSYTIDTIGELKDKYPGTELYFLLGIDSFLEIRTWRDWERLLSLCVFVVLSREGHQFADLTALGFLDASPDDLVSLDDRRREEVRIAAGGRVIVLERIPFYEISSTDIRQRVRQRRSIKYCLPDPVEHYIIENKLYG
jgi:nicotinate-nucleotide adenylyltransferase